MQFLVVGRTQRNSKLVGYLASERIGLGEGQMVGLDVVFAADDAALAGNELQMLRITQSFRFAER